MVLFPPPSKRPLKVLGTPWKPASCNCSVCSSSQFLPKGINEFNVGPRRLISQRSNFQHLGVLLLSNSLCGQRQHLLPLGEGSFFGVLDGCHAMLLRQLRDKGAHIDFGGFCSDRPGITSCRLRLFCFSRLLGFL